MLFVRNGLENFPVLIFSPILFSVLLLFFFLCLSTQNSKLFLYIYSFTHNKSSFVQLFVLYQLKSLCAASSSIFRQNLQFFMHTFMIFGFGNKSVIKNSNTSLTLRLIMSYIYIYIYDISSLRVNDLTLILLTLRKS
jgi:hypothetical protein